MSCNFSITFSGSPASIVNKAKTAVTSQGGNFQGDEGSGQFKLSVFGATIGGSYTITGQELQVIIDDKPFLVPCSTIEGYLKKELS